MQITLRLLLNRLSYNEGSNSRKTL